MKIINSKMLDTLLAESTLRGYWPLNDGLGLSARDLTKYNHIGFIKDCEWKPDIERPYSLRSDKKQEESLQAFHPTAAAQATFYTNGEILVIAYPSYTFWGKQYNGVAQKFSLNTGLLTDEIEYDEFSSVGSACFNYDGKSMWHYNRKSEGQVSCHSMQPPTDISPWRADRMKRDKELLQNENKLSIKQLIEKYGLIGIDYQPDKDKNKEKDNIDNKEQKDSNIISSTIKTTNELITSTINGIDLLKTPRDDEDNENDEKKDDTDLLLNNDTPNKLVVSDDINSTHTLANVVIKLDSDYESLRSVDTNDGIPMSLSIPFGVDLASKTFESLIDIAEKLAEEFYSIDKDNKEEKHNTGSKKQTKTSDESSQKDSKTPNTQSTKRKDSTTQTSTKKDNKTNTKGTTTSTVKKESTDKTDTKKKKKEQLHLL